MRIMALAVVPFLLVACCTEMEDFHYVSAGGVVSTRAESGDGDGWVASLGYCKRSVHHGTYGFMQAEVSHVSYDEVIPRHGYTRLVWDGGIGIDSHGNVGYGLGASWSGDATWAVGPKLLLGIGDMKGRFMWRLEGGLYLWLGERRGDFDPEIERDARLITCFRF